MHSFSLDGRTPTETVLYSVADVTGTPATQLPRLYHTIDPDALNRVVDGGVEVSFEYYGTEVTVTGEEVLVQAQAGVDDFGAEVSC